MTSPHDDAPRPPSLGGAAAGTAEVTAARQPGCAGQQPPAATPRRRRRAGASSPARRWSVGSRRAAPARGLLAPSGAAARDHPAAAARAWARSTTAPSGPSAPTRASCSGSSALVVTLAVILQSVVQWYVEGILARS